MLMPMFMFMLILMFMFVLGGGSLVVRIRDGPLVSRQARLYYTQLNVSAVSCELPKLPVFPALRGGSLVHRAGSVRCVNTSVFFSFFAVAIAGSKLV